MSFWRSDGFEVVGEAEDGESAVEAARRLRPDVVLLDIQLPGLDGFAVAERIVAQGTSAAVVLISSRAASAYRRRLKTSPARGFIAKAELSGECLTRCSPELHLWSARGSGRRRGHRVRGR